MISGIRQIACLAVALSAGQATQAAPVILSTGNVEGAPASEVVVPIILKGAKEAKGVRGMSIRLNYDAAILTFKSIEQGPTLTKAILGEDSDPEADPGKLALGFVCSFKTPTSKELSRVDEDGVVLKVQFKVNPDATPGQKSPLVIDNYRIVDTATPPFELPVIAEKGEFTVTSTGLADLPWLWIAIGGGVAFLLLMIVLITRRGKKKEPVPVVSTAVPPPAALPRFSPEGATTFAHTCSNCGGIIQLPVAMKGQSFQCGACGATQVAK